MGLESYGLVGFYLTLQAVFAVLDMGLTATVSRELARLSVTDNNTQAMRNLVRTLESVYWIIALAIMLAVYLLAPWIAGYWLNAQDMSEETIHSSIILMGLMIALRLPYGFYGGGLLGLQSHVLLNIIKIIVETLRSGGAVFMLWLVSPTIGVFFQWQLAISVLGTVWMAVALWRCLPGHAKAGFQVDAIRNIWRFAAGMGIVSALAAVLVQMDKLVLSKMLSLEQFAYYSLASIVSLALYVIIGSVYSAAFPRLTQMVELGNEAVVKSFYHKCCQLMTVLVMPLALVLSLFALPILQLWIQDDDIAAQVAPILSLLTIGTALNGMMSLPLAMQLAHGWTRLVVYMNLAAILVLLPALIPAVNYYGVLGAASIWVILNAGYIIAGLTLMHRRLLKGEMLTWVVRDFAWPTSVAFVIVALCHMALPDALGTVGRVLWIIMAVLLGWLAAAMAAPAIRMDILHRLGYRRIHE